MRCEPAFLMPARRHRIAPVRERSAQCSEPRAVDAQEPSGCTDPGIGASPGNATCDRGTPVMVMLSADAGESMGSGYETSYGGCVVTSTLSFDRVLVRAKRAAIEASHGQ
jgi:hypothetical protein